MEGADTLSIAFPRIWDGGRHSGGLNWSAHAHFSVGGAGRSPMAIFNATNARAGRSDNPSWPGCNSRTRASETGKFNCWQNTTSARPLTGNFTRNGPRGTASVSTSIFNPLPSFHYGSLRLEVPEGSRFFIDFA